MPVTINGSGSTGSINGLTIPATGFGKVLQVVHATHATEVSTASTTYVTTNLSATITLSSTSSKVLILASMPAQKTTDNIFSGAYVSLFRGTVSGTNLSEAYTFTTGANSTNTITHVYLDSPATVAAQTYTLGLKSNSVSTTVKSCPDNTRGNLILIEVGP